MRLADLIEVALNQSDIRQEQMANQAQNQSRQKSSSGKNQIGNAPPGQSQANQPNELEAEKTRLEEARRLQKKMSQQFKNNRKNLANLIRKKKCECYFYFFVAPS